MACIRRYLAAGALIALGSCLPSGTQAQAILYSGKVVDDSGKGIAAATVQVDGSSQSVQTGADGAFTLSTTVTGIPAPSPRPALAASAAAPVRADGRRPATEVRAAGFLASPGSVAPPLPLAKAAADAGALPFTLVVSKAGYLQGRFVQNKATAQGLNLTLLKAPDSSTGYATEKKLCMDEANRYRATVGLAPVAWSKTLEAFADTGARYDAALDKAHAHFSAAGRSNPSDAENEIPGWPLRNYKTVAAVMIAGLKMMWEEGPGGGHYENIRGNHTQIGCGIHVTPAGNVWIVQDFR